MKEVSKEELKKSFQIVADVLKNDIIKNLQKLFTDIQEDRPKEEIVKKVLDGSPFVKQEPVQTQAEQSKSQTTAKKWTDGFNKVIHYAASESTPLSRRKLDYLVKKLPFSAKAISRQVYRLGYKWRNGKVVLA